MNSEKNDRIAVLTLDLEQDYGRVNAYNCFAHMEQLCQVLVNNEIEITAFIVGKILEDRQPVIEKLTQAGAEFALHSYHHNLTEKPDTEKEVERSKAVYQNYFGYAPRGYRAPQGKISKSHFKILKEHGFIYDSSIIPAWRPGIYRNLTAPTHPYYIDGILEIPFSVTPRVRLPLIMSYMKIFGQAYRLLINVFGLPDILIFDFHLHDLFKTESFYELPLKYRVIHSRNSSVAMTTFESFINLLKRRGYKFITMGHLVNKLVNNEITVPDISKPNADNALPLEQVKIDGKGNIT